MRSQVQPSQWSCSITAFAIVLGVPVQELIDEVGHDGSEIWWPMATPPSDRRGFHLQELINICINRGYSVTTVEPVSSIHSPEYDELGLTSAKRIEWKESIKTRMTRILTGTVGVLSGKGPSGTRHSVAWDGNNILDPTYGNTYSLKGFSIQYYHLIQKVQFGLDV